MERWRRGAVLLGGEAERPDQAASILVVRAGEPYDPSPWRALELMESAILLDGRPLFPNAPLPAELVGERVDDEDTVWYSMRPGPNLGFELADLVPDAVSDEALVEAIRAHGRMIAHHEAEMSMLIAELASRPMYQRCDDAAGHEHDAARVAASEVSLAMSWTPRHADVRVAHAVRLRKELPATLAALHAGKIDAYQARVIDDETAPLADDAELTREVEAAALSRADGKTGPALRAIVKRKVLAVAPESAEQRRRQAGSGRRVDKPFPECDDMGSMHIYGPIEDLAALFTAIDAAARARRDAAAKARNFDTAGTPLAALRFDVLADLGWSSLAAGHLGCCGENCPGAGQHLGTRHGRAATVNVTVPITTLAGISDEPGELAGFGPITAEAARRIAGDATLRRLLTDAATGALLDYGTTRYVPPQHLADHVIVRDRTCRFPTCSYPAESSQLDHTDPFRPEGTGGPTADSNLGAFHGRHHNDKTHHGFKVTQPEPGRFVINTPAGLIYHVDPEIIGPVNDPPEKANSPGIGPPVVWDEVVDEPPPF
ncbi:MAG TPA: DUF222 domain-containing protein [Jiangellales bacterium]|nr:DUF222 domain-containing protein [Jiangellales bacterium]